VNFELKISYTSRDLQMPYSIHCEECVVTSVKSTAESSFLIVSSYDPRVRSMGRSMVWEFQKKFSDWYSTRKTSREPVQQIRSFNFNCSRLNLTVKTSDLPNIHESERIIAAAMGHLIADILGWQSGTSLKLV